MSRSSIAGNEWHTLDFGDVEKELAAKLSDDDISKVLLHIDAANKLKILRLTNCINISGAGLVSLSGSTSIEQIDLSLVGAHQRPILDPKPPLDCDLVLPILDCIINHGRCQLKHLQFPHMWRGGDYDQFNEFIERYDDSDEMLRNGRDEFEFVIFGDIDVYFGIQVFTCSECTKYYAPDRDDEDGNALYFCNTCERYHCTECSAMVECQTCEEFLCVDCIPHTFCASPSCTDIVCNDCLSNKCHKCSKKWCTNCSHSCIECDGDGCNQTCCRECSAKEGVNGVHRCDVCHTKLCVECSEKEKVNGVHWCDVCDEKLCDKCRLIGCQRGNNCSVCVKMVAPLLLEENRQLRDERTNLEDKNNLLGGQNKSLGDEIKRLSDENEALQRKLSLIRMVAADLTPR